MRWRGNDDDRKILLWFDLAPIVRWELANRTFSLWNCDRGRAACLANEKLPGFLFNLRGDGFELVRLRDLPHYRGRVTQALTQHRCRATGEL